MVQLKRNLLSVALASATMMLVSNAYAQAADQQAQQGDQAQSAEDRAKTLDTVVVTGIRAGIERAIDTKRDSREIVEAISAEDIGKLPDISIAESIARLPGLTMQRVAGRSSTVSIRGLSDDFGTTLLNGREQVSVGHNRGVEFDQYPSELISGVVVYKTPNAQLVGQGLSGTVDLHTVRPLDYEDRQTVVNFRGEHNSNGDLNSDVTAWGNRFSVSYIDQFMDNTLGVAIGYAHLDTPGQANQWEAWGYPSVDVNGDGQNEYLLGGSKSQAFSSENTRDGLMGAIQYRPSDTYETTLDLYYSKFEIDETLRFMETGLGWSGAALSNAVVQNGQVVSGTFTGVRPVLRNDNNTKDDKIFSAGWNNRFKFSDDWSAEVDVSYSKAERDEMLLETYAGLGPATDPNAFDTVDFVMGSDHPMFSYGRDYTDPTQVVLTDPGGWGQEGFVKFPHVEDELWAVRADFERSFAEGMFSSLGFGLNYTSREKTRGSGLEAFLCLAPNPDGGGCNVNGIPSGATATIPSSSIVHPVDLGFTGIPGSISYDIDDIFGMYGVHPLVHQDVTNKNWTVNEDVTTGYMQLNIDTDLGSVPMRGNLGLQVVHTDQSSEGFLVPLAAVDQLSPISGGDDYIDYLPSMNLSFSFANEQVLRVAAGRQLARPRLDWMRANQNVSIDNQQNEWRANGGNPELKPWEANAYDMSYEKYFGENKGYVAVAGFYKDLRTWVTEQTVEYDFSGYDPGDAPPPPSPIGEITTPVNGEGGSIYGWEFSASVPFDLLWAPLEGFGLQGAYSDTTSNITDPVTGQDRTISGLSEEVWNISLYYERYGWQARVSQRHRSPFLGEIQGFGADRSQRYINEEDIVDLQFGYSFQQGSALDGVSVLFQVLNATDEPYREYFLDSGLPQKHSEYGRTYMFGVTYKF